MDSPQPHGTPQESADIFSLSDQVLSDRLQFIEEIGFGNWGSVWLCRPKASSSSPVDNLVNDQKIAVKLVHRSKTSTTAARVRSLWNEMKIVRTFKSDPHPSIIPFHSFIITPSYALITMAFLPTLVPVEVEETKARNWFRLLLSGVEFLHKRGVVHNDIKPANILLSHKNIPVLVDFGFAEKYDLDSTTAFHSNLSYGTPEYLSPERARGLPHDTRKSDVWSLGVTFFEILLGRTPFEHSDGEQFTTKEDLEKYWSRTLRGKWVGSWKMSKAVEKMIRRMIAPNADLRCTASEAMSDSYWQVAKASTTTSHKRSSSYTSSVVFEKDMAKLMETPSPKKRVTIETPPGLPLPKLFKEDKENSPAVQSIAKVKSQPKMTIPKAVVPPRKRAPIAPIMDLSPIKASPPSSPLASAAGKENTISLNSIGNAGARRPFGAVANRTNLPPAPLVVKPTMDGLKDKRKGRVLGDLTGASRNSENVNVMKKDRGKAREKEKDHVRERVREWEREKERLREMERLEEMERDRDEELREMAARQQQAIAALESETDKENRGMSPPVLPPIVVATSFSELNISQSDLSRRAGKESIGLSIFKHSIKKSIDKTVQMYKSSAIAQVSGRATPSRSQSIDLLEGADIPKLSSKRESWEIEAERGLKSPLHSVRDAEQTERIAADSRVDRMTIWMKNVEKVVEDARENFASSSTQPAPLPPLPLAPISRQVSLSASQTRTTRSSRLPRKVLTASQIFSDEGDRTVDQTTTSITTSFANATANDTSIMSLTELTEGHSQLMPDLQTPSRRRRATVSGLSPERTTPHKPFEMDMGSPSKRKEKSRSHGNLFQLHITPVSQLEAELDKPVVLAPPARLSAFLDRSLFIAPPVPREESDVEDSSCDQSTSFNRGRSFDELTSSPYHVKPYPPRKQTSLDVPVLDSPSQRRVEGVYDRFLMATSGVKRLGKGYQSDNTGPVSHTANPDASHYKREEHRFYSARRVMPPPISSDDQRRTVSVDELGMICPAAQGLTVPTSPLPKDEGNTTVGLVRRAFKATSRRLSRIA